MNVTANAITFCSLLFDIIFYLVELLN